MASTHLDTHETPGQGFQAGRLVFSPYGGCASSLFFKAHRQRRPHGRSLAPTGNVFGVNGGPLPARAPLNEWGGVSGFRSNLRRRVPPLAAGQSCQLWRGTMPAIGVSRCQSQPVRSVQMLRPANDNWFLSLQADPHRGPRRVASRHVARGLPTMFPESKYFTN